MPTLSKELRRTLQNVVAAARLIVEAGAEQALSQLAVHHSESWPGMLSVDKELREKLRAHGKQLGDKREANRTQEVHKLKQACAYEHWHRLLFARFLAENNLLIHPDFGQPIALEEVKELAREQNADWLSIAASFAQRMLLEVFRPDDPVLELILPPETRQKLEEQLDALPPEVFTADDSLGWVYQFWQRDDKNQVNKSEVDIGANELAAVTQLFTEDYMVLFLLHNTLGAWWTAKRRLEAKSTTLPGYQWKYLRLNEDGVPSAGGYYDWPRSAAELRVLDPCMGSGHFLTAALPILVRMRMDEECLSISEAVSAVLSENVFGLELDPRCSQIAAFNIAMTAWRLLGEHANLPVLNLACSGLTINAAETDWLSLAGQDGGAREEMRRLYSLFRDAPTLGSLIDPRRLQPTVYSSGAENVYPLLEEALRNEGGNEAAREWLIAAQGVLAASRILAGQFSLVATNVPYLGRGKQGDLLAKYCAEFHSDARGDLATCFVDRCLRFCHTGGSVALVTPQSWLFLGTYRAFREHLLRSEQWDSVVRLGPNAFQVMNWWRATTALVTLSRKAPEQSQVFSGFDVSAAALPSDKADALQTISPDSASQAAQLSNPDCRIRIAVAASEQLLNSKAGAFVGLQNGDSPRFLRGFWELYQLGSEWAPFHMSFETTGHFKGKSGVILWEEGKGQLSKSGGLLIKGREAWGRFGVVIRHTNHLPASLYHGELYDQNIAAIVPSSPDDLAAIWAYCSSPEYNDAVRQVDQGLKVTNSTLAKVPFDPEYWRTVAQETYPAGLPTPHSADPTQWLFNGHPKGSERPLHVAVARLVGYRWPRQTGSSFPQCPALSPDGLEKHSDSGGIVCLSALPGKASAGDQLRSLLSDAYGDAWSAAQLSELLGGGDSLEVWLRDRFFEEHCQIFDHRPFIWHIWDGRQDGFHALVNYHKLAAPDGEGLKLLEKLIYTSLRDWIARQEADVASSVEGADARHTAALHLQSELQKILVGECPYDIFARWKPVCAQAIGWNPDLNDGVRVNIRPWMTATLAAHTKPKKGSCILRVTPRIAWGRDRGEESVRDKSEFPWFADSTVRRNDVHLTLDEKRRARERRIK